MQKILIGAKEFRQETDRVLTNIGTEEQQILN
jgi:hypothetical protein